MGAEFVCLDCGAWVFNAANAEAPIPPVCLACLWRRTIDPEDRQAIDEYLDAIEKGRT
jgi:hypothetical protein